MGKTEFIKEGHQVIRYSTKENKPHSYYVACYSGPKRMMIKCDNYTQVNNLINSKVYGTSAPIKQWLIEPTQTRLSLPVATAPIATAPVVAQTPTTYKEVKKATKKTVAKKIATKKSN